jgi:hypothetical protein
METQQGNGQTRGLKPFVKGDARINRHSRPAGFDVARQMALAIACEDVTLQNGRKMSAIEAMLRSWARSKEPSLQIKFVELCYGKVPDRVEATGLENKPTLILHYPHEMPGWQPSDDGANYRSGRVFRPGDWIKVRPHRYPFGNPG